MHEEKARLRAQMRQRLAAMRARELEESAAAITHHLLQSDIWQNAPVIFCYAGDPGRGEVDTRPLLEAALAGGKTLAVPLCTARGVMEARILHMVHGLRPGRYGLPEPPADSQTLAPEWIALCIVPCLSAAPDGTRLGWGGGYYDRFLPLAKNAVLTALCREELLSQALPREPHDVPVQRIVTERRIIQSR